MYLLSSARPVTAPMTSHHRGLAGAQQPQHEQRDHRPEEQVEGGGREKVHGRQHLGGGRSGERRDQLGGAAAAEFAGHEGGEHDDGAADQRGQEPQRDHGLAEQVGGQPGHRGHEGRLVDVPPREVASAGEEVQLVAVVAVPGRDRELHGDDHGRDGKDDPGREGRARRRVGVLLRLDRTGSASMLIGTARSARRRRTR